MRFSDISHDAKTVYRLASGEQHTFLLINRGGDITFELFGATARAHIFAFFIGKDHTRYSLNLVQKHTAAFTASHALVKCAITDTAAVTYTGTVRIGKDAAQSDASQESRGLLLSRTATLITEPKLEISTHDVKCTHAATVSPLNVEALFYAKSRGVSAAAAQEMLLTGFFGEALEAMTALGIDTTNIRTRLITLLPKHYVAI